MTSNIINQKADKWLEILTPYLRDYRREAITFKPENSALLVIDMQRFFLDPHSHAYMPDAVEIIDNIRRLLRAYRDLFLPIIFTRHALLQFEDPGAAGRWWRDVLYEQDEMSSIVEELKPLPHEIVVRKTRYSAFRMTNLDSILKDLGVTQVVITGVMTHLCCETTARDAFIRDYDVFFVIDATATSSEDLHIASLKTLSDGFALPVKTDEVISWLRPRT
ncbi:MAG: isochorismatase family cysteine hydrolase [Methanomassiliicoccales archaeon]